MEIIEDNKYYIIKPLSSKIDKRETCRIINEVLQTSLQIGIDLSCVKDCTIDFFEQISNIRNMSLFNIQSDILSILLSMNLDKKLKLFVSELDFREDVHMLVKRKFSIV